MIKSRVQDWPLGNVFEPGFNRHGGPTIVHKLQAEWSGRLETYHGERRQQLRRRRKLRKPYQNTVPRSGNPQVMPHIEIYHVSITQVLGLTISTGGEDGRLRLSTGGVSILALLPPVGRFGKLQLRSVAIVVGLVRSFGGDAEVGGLVVREAGELHSQVVQVEGGHLLIQLPKEAVSETKPVSKQLTKPSPRKSPELFRLSDKYLILIIILDITNDFV